MRLPFRYWDESVKLSRIPHTCAHKEHVKEYGQNLVKHMKNTRGLFLWGPSSSGKSAIAGMCLRSLLDYNYVYTGLFVRANKVPEYEIENTLFDEKQTMMERCKSVDLLVIDEYQCYDSGNSFREDTIEHLLRDRADEGKTTIITTNKPLMEINDKAYTFMQVVQEYCEIIKITGVNFRTDKNV